MAQKDDYLVDLLVDMSLVSPDQLTAVKEETSLNGEGIIDTLLGKKIIRSFDVAQAKAAHFGYEVHQPQRTAPHRRHHCRSAAHGGQALPHRSGRQA